MSTDRFNHFVIPASHPCLDGHFPGNPIVPGVVILDEVAAAFRAEGPGVRICAVKQVKFLSFLVPETPCAIRFATGADGGVRFECRSDDAVIASGLLQTEPDA
jgi:3-hydroxyacyl-[acyl-carrier-protein] dehydratase